MESLYPSRGSRRDELHAEASARLKGSRNPCPLVEELLDFCAARRSEEGLDLGADVLAAAGSLPLRYAERYLAQESPRWPALPHPGDLASDDRWTMLIRAAGRVGDDKPRLLGLLRVCLASGSRGLREAVVEGLQGVGTPEAVSLLRELARGEDPLIARIAGLALDDLAED